MSTPSRLDPALAVRTVSHVVPTTQRVLDEQDEIRRAVDRERRRSGRLDQLRRWRRGQPVLASTFATPATEAAIERGVRVDSDEWTSLLESEVMRVVRQISDRRRYATKVLDRYERFTKAVRKRREEQDAYDRAIERGSTPFVSPTLPDLLDRLGMSPEFAVHLVQPYCACEREAYEDGWTLCPHARDEGITP